MAYIGKSPTGSGVRQRYVYTATGGETSLSGADDNSKTLKFTDGEYVDVHLNGIQLVQGTDYGVGTANTISSLAALAASDVVEITVYDVYNVAKINSEAMRNRWYYTATGGETSLTTTQISGLSFPANAEIEVRLNGIALVQGTDFNTTTANTVGGLAALSSGNVVEIVYYEAFQLADVVSKAAGGTYNGDIVINADLTVDTDTLYVDSTNNRVGIGTASPSQPFHVKGGAVQFENTQNTYLQVNTSDTHLYTAGSHPLRLGTNSTERMRIDSSGRVIMGATSYFYSDAVLQIEQTNTASGNNGCIALQNQNASGGSGVRTVICRNSSGTYVGGINNTSTATSFQTTSDHRLKENDVDMTGAIARVKQLQPKRFNFIADTTDTLFDGFMAHEVQTVVPEAISGTHNEVDDDGNPVYQGIDQSKLVPLLTGALKEAIAKIEALETRVQALEDA